MAELSRISARPARVLDAFTAWRQLDGGKAQALRIEARTAEDALAEASALCSHKDVLFVLHTDGLTGDKMLRCYVIRQGRPEWRHCPQTKVTKQVRPEKPDLIYSLPVTHFAPVEPWRWEPGADVVGHRSDVVEGRAL